MRREAKKFCFALILCTPTEVKVSESGIKREKSMGPLGGAGMKKVWLKSVDVMFNVKACARQRGRTRLSTQTQLSLRWPITKLNK